MKKNSDLLDTIEYNFFFCAFFYATLLCLFKYRAAYQTVYRDTIFSSHRLALLHPKLFTISRAFHTSCKYHVMQNCLSNNIWLLIFEC